MAVPNRGLSDGHLNDFFGRTDELSELMEIVPARRVVTITGQAGIGKSRTALRLIDRMRRSLSGSVFVVEMGGKEPHHLTDAIAEALGSPDLTIEEIIRVLGDKPSLILIDDLQNASSSAPVFSQLLRNTTESRFIVTSRERTGLSTESAYTLGPLATPSFDAMQKSLARAFDSPTAELLLNLIRLDDTNFEPTSATMSDLLAICKATDGVPRFIEAAARAVCVLGVHAAASAVAEDESVLDTFIPADSRLLTSKAVLSEASTRISADAMKVLQRLSLFQSGGDLQFAAELFADGSIASLASPLAQLADHSLLRLETVGEERRLQVPLHYRRHILNDWKGTEQSVEYQRLAEGLKSKMRQCKDSWFSNNQVNNIQMLNRHATDITKLLGSMTSDPECAHEALELISGLRYYWQLHPVDPWPRARDWLAQASDLDKEHDSISLRALLTDSYIAFHEGDLVSAKALLGSSQSDFDSKLVGRSESLFALFVEALIDLSEDEASAAESKIKRVLDESLKSGVRDHIGEKYWYLAVCQIADGREDEASATLNDGLAYCQTVGDRWGRAYMRVLIALISLRHENPDEAVSLVRESVDVMSEFGDRTGIAVCVRLLVAISTTSGRDESASRLADLLPKPLQPTPPVPLPELEQMDPSATGSLDWPQDSSMSEILSRIIDGVDEHSGSQEPSAPSVLSRREYETAALVADGLSNPAIAARLVLSRRTVEGHVQRILVKLGFRSRSQIAVWFTQQSQR